MKALVVHAPQFAEGWNQLGYVLFLAGRYDASLAAIEQDAANSSRCITPRSPAAASS